MKINFEGRYLIRWGIPGWILLISIYIFLLIVRQDLVKELFNSGGEILAITAILTVLGIPIGYLLNQIHHVWVWVIRVDWDKYFEYELKLNTKLEEVHENQEKRYKYLLTRVHELGGILIAFLIVVFISFVFLIVLLCNKQFDKSFYLLIYLIVVSILMFVVWISRNYFQSNLDALTNRLAFYDYNKVKK